jgi:hypothetical protein
MGRMDNLPGVSVINRLVAVAGSRHLGRATRAARVLNFVGTIRGVATTALVLSGAAGGAATINTVRQDLAGPPDPPAAQHARPSATPPSAAALRATAEGKLRAALASDSAATEELRKIAVVSGAPLDALLADAKRQMQLRYDRGLAQLILLVGPANPPGSESSASPVNASTLLVINALVQIIADDLTAIVVRTTQTATGQPVPAASPDPAATASSDGATRATLWSDAAGKLLTILDANTRSADDLRKVATVLPAKVDPLIAETKRLLRARYDEGIGLLDTLIGPIDLGATTAPSAAPSLSAVNALIALIASDLNAILADGLHAVGAPVTALRTPAPPPSFVPPPPAFAPSAPVRQPPVVTPGPTAPPRTATPAPRTAPPATPTPRATVLPTGAPTPAPRTSAPATVAPKPTAPTTH